MDRKPYSGVDGADAAVAQTGATVGMAATKPCSRPGRPDDSGDSSTAPRLSTSIKRMESNSGDGVHSHVRYGQIWYGVQW